MNVAITFEIFNVLLQLLSYFLLKKEWIQTLDPAFIAPIVQTIKASLYTIAKDIEYKITLQLKPIDYVNVGVNGWFEATNRSFDGYVVDM